MEAGRCLIHGLRTNSEYLRHPYHAEFQGLMSGPLGVAMECYTIDLGPFGIIPLPMGGVLRIGDSSVVGADLIVPIPGLHLLLHGTHEGVLIINCGSEENISKNTHETSSNYLKPSEIRRIGSIDIQVLRVGTAGSESAATVGRQRQPSHFIGYVGVGTAVLMMGLWSWEGYRVSLRERSAALHIADTAMAMLAEAVYGSGDGSSAYYDVALRDRWLDQILTVDISRENAKASGYHVHLDEDPQTGLPRLLAESPRSFWRSALGLAHRSFTCVLERPQLITEEGEEIGWEWLGADATGFIVPRRLDRRGVSEGYLYNAQRYRGFTWPLREIAQNQPENVLRQVLDQLNRLPELALQAFPDRHCEKSLWDSLANLGESESFLWELSPELAPQSRPRQVVRQVASAVAKVVEQEPQFAVREADGEILNSENLTNSLSGDRLQFPSLDEIGQ